MTMNYYVLACETGRESKNITLLKKTVERFMPGCHIEAYSPVRESREFCAKTWSMKVRPILPGYIIVISDSELWRIQKDIFMMSETCYGFLRNLDKSYELRGSDRDFAQWIEDNQGFIRTSSVRYYNRGGLCPDQRITVLSGPLKDLKGRILSVYKGVRVTVEINFLNEVKRISLPIEIVERVGDDVTAGEKLSGNLNDQNKFR